MLISAITGAVVSASVEVVSSSVEVVEESLSLLVLQEIMVRLKRNMEIMMSRCFTRFPNCLVYDNSIYNINRFFSQGSGI